MKQNAQRYADASPIHAGHRIVYGNQAGTIATATGMKPPNIDPILATLTADGR